MVRSASVHFLDRSGVLWLTDQGSLIRLYQNRYESYTHELQTVDSIEQHVDGSIWLLDQRKTLARLDGDRARTVTRIESFSATVLKAGRDGSQRVGFPGATHPGTHLPRARVEAKESAVGVEEIGKTDHDIDPNLRVEDKRGALVLVPVPMCRRVRRRT